MNTLHAMMSTHPIHTTQMLILALDGLDICLVWFSFLFYLMASMSSNMSSIIHINLNRNEITGEEGWNIFYQLNKVDRTYTDVQQSSLMITLQ